MLSPKGLGDLLNILGEEQTRSQSFETLCNKSHHCFRKEAKYSVACALLMILQNDDLLPAATQRLTAVVLLYDLYRKDDVLTTPFLHVFVKILRQDKMNGPVNSDEDPIIGRLPKFPKVAIGFISQLLTSNPKDLQLLKKSASHVLNSEPDKYPIADTDMIEKIVDDRLKKLPPFAKHAIPTIIGLNPQQSLLPPDESTVFSEGFQSIDGELPTTTSTNDDNNSQGDDVTLTDIISKCIEEQQDSFMTADMMRYEPPLHYAKDELVWLHADDPYDFKLSYDESDHEYPIPDMEAKMLMASAFKTTLPLNRMQYLVDIVEKDNSLISRIGLTSKKFPQLVENNPMLAVDFLLKLMNSKHITDYFSVLVNMEMSLHSMEVVNRLTTTVDLPKEFIHLYIAKCIDTCETIKDRFMQNRLVRLVCVFLQSLIRNKIINVQEIYLEVHSFCLQFSNIREATVLFKLVKNMEETDDNNSLLNQPIVDLPSDENSNNNNSNPLPEDNGNNGGSKLPSDDKSCSDNSKPPSPRPVTPKKKDKK